MKKSPYLYPGRLAQVIDAIEVLSARRWAGISIIDWVHEVEVPEGSTVPLDSSEQAKHNYEQAKENWTTVFREHPEFFKLYDVAKGSERKVILRLRGAFPLNYDPRNGREVATAELPAPPKLYDEYTKRPLKASETNLLIKTAVDLHTRAIAERRESRLYVPAAIAVIGAAVGELLKQFGPSLVHWLGWSSTGH